MKKKKEISQEEADIAKPSRAQNVRKMRTTAIQDAAEHEFAISGYEGTTIQAIADRAGLQKRQVLYFYQNKESLYRVVIDRIFSEWRSGGMEDWGSDPNQTIPRYIDLLFEEAEQRPHRSKIVINEMMRGGRFGVPVMEERDSRSIMFGTVSTIQDWIDKGQMRKVDPLHFIFMLWSFQYFYAAFEPEVAYFLGKSELKKDDWADIREEVKSTMMAVLSPPSSNPVQ